MQKNFLLPNKRCIFVMTKISNNNLKISIMTKTIRIFNSERNQNEVIASMLPATRVKLMIEADAVVDAYCLENNCKLAFIHTDGNDFVAMVSNKPEL